jgi:hypothetical protein
MAQAIVVLIKAQILVLYILMWLVLLAQV